MNNNKISKLIYKLRDHLIKENIYDLRYKNARFMFNRYRSPDGALGFFVLCKKDKFLIKKSHNLAKDLYNKKLESINIKRLITLLEFDCKLSDIENINTLSNRIQDKFEDCTEKILKKHSETFHSDREEMNDYDFKWNNILIEVKSDQWKYTGNIALELLRDYNENYERNIGSIIKTKADFWQEYYYDRKNNEVSSELFYVKDLRNEVSRLLNDINLKLVNKQLKH